MKKSKLTLYKTEEIEVVINEETGETFSSVSATARMCGVSETALRKFIKTSNLLVIKSAKIQTGQGIRSSNLLNEEQILDCLYKYNPQLTRKFAQLGLRKFLHTEAGYEHKRKQPKQKQLYPDRSQEYKDLYKELKDIIKATKAKRHHYIHLAQTLNKVVGKIEGRTNNPISEVENLAYVLLMKKAVHAGNMFLNVTNGYNTRKAINAQILKLKPQINTIQDNLKLLE